MGGEPFREYVLTFQVCHSLEAETHAQRERARTGCVVRESPCFFFASVN